MLLRSNTVLCVCAQASGAVRLRMGPETFSPVQTHAVKSQTHSNFMIQASDSVLLVTQT